MNIEIRNEESRPTEYVKILYERYNKRNSQRLRREQTKEEGKLWYLYLRKYKVIFTRQKPLGKYIVDFYCHKARLVIEIDGAHYVTMSRMQSFMMKSGQNILNTWD